MFINLAQGFITPMTERDKCATLAVGNDTNNLTVMAAENVATSLVNVHTEH